MTETLLKRREDAEAEYERLDAEIAEAVADGRPDDEVRKLRARRRDAAEEADDAGQALLVTEERAKSEAAREAEARRRGLVREAMVSAEAFVDSARSIDAALAELEKAAAAHQLASLDVARALRRAGLSDGGRIGRMLRPFAKWSAWAGAPTFADMAEMARTPVARRRSLESLVRSVIPVITSYETARSEVTALIAFAQRQRTALVLDESHAAKNWKSLTSAAARAVAPHCKYRWLLSGTPVTNTATDLFTQVEIIEPGRGSLGSLESFAARLEEDPKASFAKDIIDRLVLRRTKEQCLDLPEKSFMDVRVELPPWQRRLYDEMRDEMVCEIEAMSGEQYRAYAPTALAKLTRLVQLACNPSLIFPELKRSPAKFEVLDGIIGDILSVPCRKVILWSNYIRTIETLLERIPGSVAIYGGTPTSERQEIAARFQGDPDVRVLIANPAAAGTGFTLTAASFTIYESLSWRYDHYAQSQDRNHRIGQTEPVTYLRLLAVDTIEEAIVTALERKSALARSLLGDEGAGDAISQLTREEMCGLLKTNRLPSA